MSDLKKFGNEELISKTKALVQEERNTTLAVIEHLQEIYFRKLHLKCGYSSLHEFLVKELSYSDGAAHRRISAMRLVQDVPEAKTSIAEGKLSLTTASQVQSFFQSEKRDRKKSYSADEKRELISHVEGASRQECERRLAEVSPSYCEKPRVINLPEDKELIALLDEYRRLAMLSDGSPQNVIKSALRTAVCQIKTKHSRNAKPKQDSSENLRIDPRPYALGSSAQNGTSSEKLQEHTKTLAAELPSQIKASSEKQPSRYIPMPIKREIWQRDQGKCVYRDPKTKRQCGASHHLEIDHLHPFAMDGKTSTENLQLLCRAHNQLRAIEIYGKRTLPEKRV